MQNKIKEDQLYLENTPKNMNKNPPPKPLNK